MDILKERMEIAKEFAISELKKKKCTKADIDFLESNYGKYYGFVTKSGLLESPEEIAGMFIFYKVCDELLIDTKF